MTNNATLAFPTDIGSYTVSDAARFLKMSSAKIRRWIRGYHTKTNEQPPLWNVTYPIDGELELSFRDLIELKFLNAFENAGLSAKAIRSCYQEAQNVAQDERPFSTRKFQTDSQKLFFTQIDEIVEIKTKQLNFKEIVQQSFKDLVIEDDVVTAWHPLPDSNIIIINPKRSYGTPIVDSCGVPTFALFDSFKAERSIKKTAYYFDVTEAEVEAAIAFEESLLKSILAKAA